MKKLLSQMLVFGFILTFSTIWGFGQNVSAETPKPSATPPIEEDTDVVKISTALIQLDVVVTDKNGKLITDLKPEDFEVSENGERQTITNLSYFSGRNNSTIDGNLNANGSGKPAGAMPTVGEVRRTVAIVVDDLRMSAQSITSVKKDLAKFINEQVQPSDLVAILKTSGSVGVLQQFTTDKRKLLDVIESLQYKPATSVGLSPFAPISISFAEQIRANMSGGGSELSDKAKASIEQRSSVEPLPEINRSLIATSGALGVLNSTISAMTRLPGRKSVLYAADGIYSLFDKGMSASIEGLGGSASIFTETKKLEEDLRGITEIANRATIAIYTLDSRGALPLGFSAADSMRGGMTDRESGGQNENDITRRSSDFKISQQGLKFLSEETSGKAFLNTNDLGKGLRETLDSQNGYYILAYQPDADTFDAEKRRFNKLNVKVKRPNVNVSYRSGFFNIAEESRKTAETPERIFLQKIFSPYKYTDINLQIASIYAADEQVSTVRSFISIEPQNLQFTDGADGNKTAKFDLIAVTFNESGIPIAQVGQMFEVKVSAKGYEKLLEDGIACNLVFATRTRGAQQIKVAVRDVGTNKIGTASQTIDTPNFDKDQLSLSGMLLQNFTAQEWQSLQSGKAPADTASRMQANTARRQFKKGTVLSFNYAVYAAPSLRSKSQAQFVVLKDGKEIFKGAAEDLSITPTGKMQRINRGGAFQLGTNMAAGKYVLQISVGGDAVKEPRIQQIDFELVN